MYLDGCFQLQQDRLRYEDFSCLGTEETNLRLQELDLLSRPATPHFQKTINDRVQVHFLVSHDEVFLEWKTDKTDMVDDDDKVSKAVW